VPQGANKQIKQSLPHFGHTMAYLYSLSTEIRMTLQGSDTKGSQSLK